MKAQVSVLGSDDAAHRLKAQVLAVVDYGAGNLRSVGGALDALGARWIFARQPDELAAAGAILLPGVGSAGSAMRELERRGLAAPLKQTRVPVLGICLGLQLLFEDSDEEGGTRCLGLLPGRVTRLEGAPRLPHIGWNRVQPIREHPLFERPATFDSAQSRSPDRADPRGEFPDWFYFAHSYACSCPHEVALASTEYGRSFVSAAGHDRVWGVQFHPEKSAAGGLLLLQAFLRASGLANDIPNGVSSPKSSTGEKSAMHPRHLKVEHTLEHVGVDTVGHRTELDSARTHLST
jgi:glutamine amidotransferase